jgi:hypothetical protein
VGLSNGGERMPSTRNYSTTGGSKRADGAKGRSRCGVAGRNNDAIRIVTVNIHSNETTIEKRSQEGEGFATR